VRSKVAFFDSDFSLIGTCVEFGAITVLAIHAAIFVSDRNDFIFSYHHLGASDGISFNGAWDRLEISEFAVFETTLHSFVVCDDPLELGFGENSVNTVRE
jgi:hypothetical protein